MGSARVWDEEKRAAHRTGLPMPPPLPSPPVAQAPEAPVAPATSAPQPQPASRTALAPPAPAPSAAPAPPPMPELTPQGHALLQRLVAEVPEIERLPGMRHALATLISRADLESPPTPTTAAPRSSELELLRRRANKLVRELRNARTEVKRAVQAKQVDTGVASTYREVQGLDEASPQADAKRGMLEDIFRANLELRREAS